MFVSPHISNSVARAQSVGVSGNMLAVLCGISPALLSSAARGLKPLSGDKELALTKMSLLLVEISGAIAPLRLPNDADSLANLVEFVEDNQIDASRIRSALNSVFGTHSGETPTIDGGTF